jgi:hypothetical protein
LVSDIPVGDGKIGNLFYSVVRFFLKGNSLVSVSRYLVGGPLTREVGLLDFAVAHHSQNYQDEVQKNQQDLKKEIFSF